MPQPYYGTGAGQIYLCRPPFSKTVRIPAGSRGYFRRVFLFYRKGRRERRLFRPAAFFLYRKGKNDRSAVRVIPAASFLSEKKKNVYSKAGMAGGGRGIQ